MQQAYSVGIRNQNQANLSGKWLGIDPGMRQPVEKLIFVAERRFWLPSFGPILINAIAYTVKSGPVLAAVGGTRILSGTLRDFFNRLKDYRNVCLLTIRSVAHVEPCLNNDMRADWPASRRGTSWGGKPADKGFNFRAVQRHGSEPCVYSDDNANSGFTYGVAVNSRSPHSDVH
jgi:hypothetical protein